MWKYVTLLLIIFFSCVSEKKYYNHIVTYKSFDYMIIKNDSAYFSIKPYNTIYGKYEVGDTIK